MITDQTFDNDKPTITLYYFRSILATVYCSEKHNLYTYCKYKLSQSLQILFIITQAFIMYTRKIHY